MKLLAAIGLIAGWLVLSGFTLLARLDWRDNSGNEDGFVIEQSIANGPYTEIARVPSDTRSYQVALETTRQKYCWRVRAFNGAGISGVTNQKCIRRWNVDVQ